MAPGSHLQELANERNQIARQVFLGNVVRGSGAKRANHNFLIPVSRHQDDMGMRVVGANPFDKLDALAVRQNEIGQDDAGGLACDRVQAGTQRVGEDYAQLLHRFQKLGDAPGDRRSNHR